jgi:hypothetical protein
MTFSLPPVNAEPEAPLIQWQQFFDGTHGFSVLQTENESYVLTGKNSSSSLLIKTDSSGNLLWKKNFQLEGKETFLPYLLPTEDGGYVLAGTWENKYILVSVDSEGKMDWNKTYEHRAVLNHLRALIRTNDGGYALIGTYLNQPPSDGQTLFLKIDSLGNIQWNKTIGSVGDFVCTTLQTNDEGYAIIGTIWASETDPAIPKMIKTDPDGNIQWQKTYGGMGRGQFYYTESFSGITTEDGGYLISGFAGDSSSTWRAWLLKTDSQGNMMWNKTYGEIGCLANFVVQTQDRGYAYAGVVNRKDAWIVKTDEYGNMDWNLTFEGISIETFSHSILQTNDGGYAVVGTKDDKIWLFKLTPKPPNTPVIPITLETIVIFLLIIAICITIIAILYGKFNSKKNCPKA